MLYAVTFADEHYAQIAKAHLWSAAHIGGADRVRCFTPADLDADFCKRNADILRQPRGRGFWLWKPYIILKALGELDEGDFLIYADAGTFCVNRMRHMTVQLDRDKRDIFLSSGLLPNACFTKRDAYVRMDCDEPAAYKAHTVAAGYLLLRNTAYARAFIGRWLLYAEDPRILTDAPSVCGLPELPEFIENRHDQTALSLLAYKERIQPYRSLTNRKDWRRSFHFIRTGALPLTYQTVWQHYLDEAGSDYYKSSTHPRIFVNVNVRDRRGVALWLRILRRIFQGYWWDCFANPRPFLRAEAKRRSPVPTDVKDRG